MFSFLIGSTVWIQIYKKTVPASVVDTRTASRAPAPGGLSENFDLHLLADVRRRHLYHRTPQLPVERRLHRAAVDLHPAELPGGGQLEPVGAARLLPPVAAGGRTDGDGRHIARTAVVELCGGMDAAFVIAAKPVVLVERIGIVGIARRG